MEPDALFGALTFVRAGRRMSCAGGVLHWRLYPLS
jgi:hypothetical protein